MDSYLRFQRKRKRKVIATLIFMLIASFFYAGAMYFSVPLLSTVFSTDITFYGLLFVLFIAGITSAAAHAAYTTLRDINSFYVIGYYKKTIGDKRIKTWLSGEEIYKRMQKLDEICTENGVTKLSEFGFYDDFDNEKVIWHDANEGLLTLKTIKKHLHAAEFIEEGLLTEISRLEYALDKAAEKDIQFSLLLRRINSSTNSREWAIRQGTCW